MKPLAAAAAGALALLALPGCGTKAVPPPGGVLGPGVVEVAMDVRHSGFEPTNLEVVEGTTVRFVVTNADPIDHELIVGDDEVHDRHRDGTEAEHGDVPGEVSVPAGEVRETTYRFTEAGTVVYACHLPGHLAYGMRGTVTVSP